jgi:hypothetical protein
MDTKGGPVTAINMASGAQSPDGDRSGLFQDDAIDRLNSCSLVCIRGWSSE